MYHDLHSYTEMQYVYQLPTEDFVRNFGVFSLIQKELLYVRTYFILTSEYGHTDDLRGMKVYINFIIGQPGTIPSLLSFNHH